MEKIWLKSYESGVSAEVDTKRFDSIVDLFLKSVAHYKQKPAFTNMGKSYTYQEIDALSTQFASFFQNELKLPKGERVAIMMPNVLQYPVSVFGILRAGLVVVNVNPMYTMRELQGQLKNSGATTIIVLENFAHTVESVLAKTDVKNVIVASVGDLLGFFKGSFINFALRTVKKKVPAFHIEGSVTFNQALQLGKQKKLEPIPLTHDDLAFLQYTGGTTGVAKGAMLTHGNIVSNMMQVSEWIKSSMHPGDEVIVTALPLYHIFSLTANLMTFIDLGAENILITNPRDMTGMIKELKKHKITAITGVNTLFNALINHPDFASIDFSTWRVTLGGGMAVQKTVADKWKEVTGMPLCEAYGLTETSPAACINPLKMSEYNGMIGLPVPSTDVQIRDDQGNEVPVGVSGELCIKGPQVMKGYWNCPEETASTLGADGFLATGDIAVMNEEGFLKLVDRKKDTIVVSGFNVYPNEIEEVVASHPDILEVACLGIPDEKTGEAIKIFVVAKDKSLTKEQIIAHCRENLTGYKIPRSVVFLDELPKSSVGKILRKDLKEHA